MVRFVFMIHSAAGKTGGRLEKTMKDRFSNIEQEYYGNADAFGERLSRPRCYMEYVIYIVFADTMARIKELMAIKELLEGKRLLLIVTGNQKKMLSMAHQLHPRFISCDTDRFEELGDVLEKMAESFNPDNRNNETLFAI